MTESEEKELTQKEQDIVGEREAADTRRNHGFRKDFTLGDLADHDKDMWAHLAVGQKIKSFHKVSQAWGYAGSAFAKALERVGVQIKGRGGRNIDKQMQRQRVVVEHREYKADDPTGYISGNYVYKDNELASFISEPYRKESVIISNEPRIFVKTVGV